MAYRVKESHLTCPYEPTHQILPHRMAQHIIKCKKNYPELDMRTCVFNATHVVPSKDYQAHILECPDKAIVERDIYRRQEVEDAMEIKRRACITMSEDALNLGEENWEQELVANSYNPMEAVMNRGITRPPPPGQLGKSARRAWRKAEIDRINRPYEPNNDLEDLDTSITGSVSFLGGGTSRGNSMFGERDSDKYSLTASKCNLAMRADQPLRRPKALQKNSTRIAANIFNDTLDSECMTSSRILGTRR